MRLSSKFEGRGQPTPSVATRVSPKRQESVLRPAPSPAAKNLALAHHIERLIERGVIIDYTHAARMLGVSQPRMTHIMSLLLLAPAIQEAILRGEVAPKDKELRALARVAEWRVQETSIRTTGLRVRTGRPKKRALATSSACNGSTDP